MNVLLDEDVPIQLLEPIRRLLPEHRLDHVETLGWKGKKDRFLLADAAAQGYEALITNDNRQLDSVEESKAIRDSRLHHVRYKHDARRGLDGLAQAMGSVIAGIRPAIRDLQDADGQRLVLIRAITPGKRHELRDPRIDPPPYWPSRSSSPRRQGRRRRNSECALQCTRERTLPILAAFVEAADKHVQNDCLAVGNRRYGQEHL